MFPYASVLHVANLNSARGTYSASTKPTASAVHEFLLETAAEIEGKLRLEGYTLPVPTTATSALKLLQSINALGAAWRVEIAAETRDEAPFYKELYDSAVAMISAGELDIPTGGDSIRPRSNFSSGASPMFSASQQF